MCTSGSGIPAGFVAAHLWWTVAAGYNSQEAQDKQLFVE
jgi:hypothetical protein